MKKEYVVREVTRVDGPNFMGQIYSLEQINYLRKRIAVQNFPTTRFEVYRLENLQLVYIETLGGPIDYPDGDFRWMEQPHGN